MLRNISISACYASLLLLAFWIRVQGVERLPDRQFTETDGYFYYYQASLISEHGHLPARDMQRWLPLGRDLGQTLNLYGYVLAYTHKAVVCVFPNVTLYHVSLYMPVVCFCIGLGALCLYLYHTYGLMFSFIVGVILATLPGTIERSTVGFGDRDAFCLMLGILAIGTYLASLQAGTQCKRVVWTLISGFIVFLGGISWEGFGVFLSVIIVVELWRFLTSETEEGLGRYALWVCCFVPTLYLASPAYRSGYGFAEHLAAFVLIPPLVLLGIRTPRYLPITKSPLIRGVGVFPFTDKLRPYARTVSFGLILTSVTLVLGYVWTQQNTFADTTVPLSQNAVMTAMTELANPHFGYWVFRYGGVFILGSIGLIVANKQHLDQTCLLVPLALFITTTFFREPLEKHRMPGDSRCSSIALSTLTLLKDYPWPGNVRELENIVQVASCLVKGAVFLPEHLPEGIQMYQKRPVSISGEISTPEDEQRVSIPFGTTFEAMEETFIRDTLAKFGGNVTQTARGLRIGRSTLQRKMRKYGVCI